MTKEKFTSPFMEEGFNAFKQFKFPGMDVENLMKTYQKNIELVNAAQEIAAETTKAIMELQRQYLKKAYNQWNEQVKSYCSKTPLHEKTSCHTEATKEAIDQAIEHMQEFNSIIAKSHEKINETVQKRFKECLDESLNAAKKSKEEK